MQTIPFYKAEQELRQLSQACLRTLAHKGQLLRFKPGSSVITQGQRGHEVYIVLDGKFIAFVHSEGHKERRLILDTLQPSDIFGEISHDGDLRTASIFATQTSMCAMVHGETFLQQCEQDHQLQQYLMQTCFKRNRSNIRLLTHTIFSDIYTRLTDLLMKLATQVSPKYFHIPERITHQELANWVGCSREMISRLLKDLQKGGYISRHKDQTMVLHPPLPLRW